MLTFQELQNIEDDALKALRNHGAFGRLTGLSQSAHRAQIYPRSKAPIDINLSFSLPTRLREDPGHSAIERPFHVGCFATPNLATGQIAQLSYSVLIGKGDSSSKEIARKFHFDFEPIQGRNQAEPKPSFHLQICGKLSPHHNEAGYEDEHIEHMLPSWSQPRIPSQPMSLALILNWLFLEFGNHPSVTNARLSDQWHKVVRTTERSVLLSYYQACADFLSGHRNNDHCFLSKHLYEQE